MLNEPRLEDRAVMHYAAIRSHIRIEAISTHLPPLIAEVFGWLQRHGIAPVGPPFFRYLQMGTDQPITVDVGVPVATPISGDGRVIADALPAGRYVVATHVGPYDGLRDASARFMAWAAAHDVTWQTSADGREWGAWVEFYPSDPAIEPDPQKWITEIVALTATSRAADA